MLAVHLLPLTASLSPPSPLSTQFPYSMIAAASVYVAQLATDAADPFSHALARHSGYTEAAIQDCAQHLANLMRKAPVRVQFGMVVEADSANKEATPASCAHPPPLPSPPSRTPAWWRCTRSTATRSCSASPPPTTRPLFCCRRSEHRRGGPQRARRPPGRSRVVAGRRACPAQHSRTFGTQDMRPGCRPAPLRQASFN